MNQVKRRALFIIIAVVIVLPVVFLINRPLKTPARNLIYILVDALRSDHLRCYGYNRTISPSIDKLAEDGILFNHREQRKPFEGLCIVGVLISEREGRLLQ